MTFSVSQLKQTTETKTVNTGARASATAHALGLCAVPALHAQRVADRRSANVGRVYLFLVRNQL